MVIRHCSVIHLNKIDTSIEANDFLTNKLSLVQPGFILLVLLGAAGDKLFAHTAMTQESLNSILGL